MVDSRSHYNHKICSVRGRDLAVYRRQTNLTPRPGRVVDKRREVYGAFQVV